MVPSGREAAETDHEGPCSPLPHAVRGVLRQEGLADRQHASFVSGALKLKHSTSAWRKLSAKAPWTDEDLMLLALALDMTPGEFMRRLGAQLEGAKEAFVMVGGSAVPCSAAIGGPVVEEDLPRCDLVVVAREGALRIIEPREVAASERPLRVYSWSGAVQMRQRATATKPLVAVLDDDTKVPLMASEEISEAFLTDVFGDDARLCEELGRKCYDAFVIDWMMKGKTTEDLIRTIRQHEPSGKKAPIYVVTSAVGSGYAVIERDLARVVREYDCRTRQKPVSWYVFKQEIEAELRKAA